MWNVNLQQVLVAQEPLLLHLGKVRERALVASVFTELFSRFYCIQGRFIQLFSMIEGV